MIANGRMQEGRDRTAKPVKSAGPFFKPDRARGIDRIIDYFGNALGTARWRTAPPRDRWPASLHARRDVPNTAS